MLKYVESSSKHSSSHSIENGDTQFELDIDSTEFMSSPLYHAIKSQNPYKVIAAIQYGENIHLHDTDFNSTYLHLVVDMCNSTLEQKYVPMVYALSNGGIDVNAQDYKGRTPLDIAITKELIEMMVALLRVGCDPLLRDYKAIITDRGSPFEYEVLNTFEKYEPGLWSAVTENDTGMVHMLMNSWCRINCRRDGKTLLEYARETNKCADMISILDEFEVTIEFVHATLAGDERRMLEFLMDSKECDPHIMDISYQERWSQPLTPRSLRDTAIGMGHMHVLHLLPEGDSEDGADTWRPDHAGHNGCNLTMRGMTSMMDIHANANTNTNMTTMNTDTGIATKAKTKDPDVVSEATVYQFFHPAKFQNSAIDPRRLSMTYPTAADDGADDMLQIDDKCYYFHEVDSFVNIKQSDAKRTSLPRKSIRKSCKTDYSHNWRAIDSRYGKGKETKSKMCVIS